MGAKEGQSPGCKISAEVGKKWGSKDMTDLAHRLDSFLVPQRGISGISARAWEGGGHSIGGMKHQFSSIEALESRIAPAALSAKLLAGVLTITGDPTDPTVGIIQTGGSIEVMDGATSLGIFSGATSINFNLVGGATVNLGLAGNGLPGLCKIAAHGATVINVATGSHLNGGLVVTGDESAQKLNLMDNVVVGKGLSFKGGGGVDNITIANGGTIGGNLSLASVEVGAFNASSVPTAITGSLKVNNSGDSLSAFIQTNNNAGLAISGGVRYVGGLFNDNLSLTATVTKGVTFTDFKGDNGFGLSFNSVVHGSVNVNTGVGSDGFNIQAGTIDGNLTLNFGGGNNMFFYGIGGPVSIGGNLNITAASGNDQWQGSGGLLTVGKNVHANLGNGANTISLGMNVSGSSLVVTTGRGMDNVSIDGSGTSVAAIIALGAGNDVLAGLLLDTVKSAIFNGGAGTDHLVENTFVADPIVIRSFEDFS
jgi:hypothetical protein